MEQQIKLTDIERFDGSFHSDKAHIVAMNAVTSNGLQASAKRWQAPSSGIHQYSIHLDIRGITNQKSSGRCWMFAALNCMRFRIIHALDLDGFELSQNYTLFYDKLEKANYFLENILSTLSEPIGSRYLEHLLQSPEQDGGQWDMISAIVTKYGVVPKGAMPESACSSNTKEMNSLLTEKLREFACTLRGRFASGESIEALRDSKKEMLLVIYRMLCICLGTPPERFDFQVRTRSGEYISERGLTPLEFYNKYVGLDLSQYISLINAPTDDKPYMHSYTVKFLGNVVGGTPVRYVNVPIKALKDAAIAQLKAGEPVWFGCDVGKYSDRESGVMDTAAFDYETLLDTKLTLSKADRLDYGHSQMTHAMVFQGVDLDESGAPVRWCVENSWGEDRGQKGMYLMSDRWFDEYMYQVVVNKKYLPEDIVKAYGSEPIELAPWDPMGSLA